MIMTTSCEIFHTSQNLLGVPQFQIVAIIHVHPLLLICNYTVNKVPVLINISHVHTHLFPRPYMARERITHNLQTLNILMLNIEYNIKSYANNQHLSSYLAASQRNFWTSRLFNGSNADYLSVPSLERPILSSYKNCRSWLMTGWIKI